MPVNVFKIRLTALVVAAAGCVSAGTLRTAYIFQDHMVLQREQPVNVWGWADAGQEIAVRFASQEKTAQADENGRWQITLDPMAAEADGRELIVSGGGETVALRDVLVGEVWMCGGQSNMERTMAMDRSKGYIRRKEQAAQADFPLLRFINLEYDIAETPQDDLSSLRQKKARWTVCTPESIMQSSSVPYFFGREILETQGVPVGLIQHSISGTGSAPWIDKKIYETILPDELKRELKNSERKLASDKDWQGWEKYRAEVAAWVAAGGTGKHPAENNSLNRYCQPHVLFNALIHPLAGYTCRGMIWHRGEAGAGDVLHGIKFKAMVDHWRQLWGDDFWVIAGSLTNIGDRENGVPQVSSAHYINEQYWMNVKDISGLGFAAGKGGLTTLNDLGNSTTMPPEQFAELDPQNGVHYEAKDIAGHRYAMTARALVYGDPAPGLLAPMFKEAEFDRDRVVIKIENADGGLVFKADRAEGGNQGFVIRDGNGNLHFADVKVDGDTLTVWKEGVRDPKTVYYGFHSNPVLTVYSMQDVPLLSFRTSGAGTRERQTADSGGSDSGETDR